MNDQPTNDQTNAPEITRWARLRAWLAVPVSTEVAMSYASQMSCYAIAGLNLMLAGAAFARGDGLALLFGANAASLFCAGAFQPLYRRARANATTRRAMVEAAEKMADGMIERIRRDAPSMSGVLACPKCRSPVLKGAQGNPALKCAACDTEFIAAITPDGLMALVSDGDVLPMHGDDDVAAAKRPGTKH